MNATPEVGIGLLGLGTVGTGVFKLLSERQERIAAALGVRPVVKRILVKDRKKPRLGVDGALFAASFDEILDDPSIQVVVEVVGGRDPALRYAKDALNQGKHVVMANKELIATEGEQLIRIAQRRGVDLLFEAAVAGGIPIIRAMKESLSGDKVQRVQGIINGTTNYIITRMTDDGQPYARALKDAQLHGYAEADPSNDVDGVDAAYKLAILASIAFHTPVRFKDVAYDGIRNLHPVDIEYGRELGFALKLIAEALDRDGALELSVAPSLIPLGHPLAAVKDAFNAVLVRAEWAGELMFYGQGAGQKPTASAVVSDVIKVLHSIKTGTVGSLPTAHLEKRAIRRPGERRSRYYLRLRVLDEPGVLAAVSQIFYREDISLQCVIQKGKDDDDTVDVVFLTHDAVERHMRRAVAKFRLLPSVREVAALLRVKGD